MKLLRGNVGETARRAHMLARLFVGGVLGCTVRCDGGSTLETDEVEIELTTCWIDPSGVEVTQRQRSPLAEGGKAAKDSSPQHVARAAGGSSEFL